MATMKDRFAPDHPDDLYTALDRDFARGPLGKSKSIKDIKKASHSKTNFRKRGMGETGLTTRPITDAEKMAMCHLRAVGMNNVQIAKELKRTPASVANTFAGIAKLLDTLGLDYDWRKIMELEVVTAVRAGLNDESDSYKRANIGIQAGKGIGMFEKEGVVNFNALLAQVPESQRHRYISLPEPNPNLISIEPAKENENDGSQH